MWGTSSPRKSTFFLAEIQEKGSDLKHYIDHVTSLKTHAAQKKTTATHSLLEDQLSSQLEETKSLIEIGTNRILTIQCDEEKEMRVDLEIENMMQQMQQ